MKKTKVFSIVTFLLILPLAYLLFNSIKSKIDQDRAIKDSEAGVRNQLIIIRDAEKAFFGIHKYYTSNWDSLTNFVETGLVYNVQKREIITTRPPDKSHLGDSVRIEYDTLGSDPVMKKVFPADKFPGFDPKKIAFIPGTDKKFAISTGRIERSKMVVDVIEVIDPYPVDVTRSDKNDNPRRKFLRFGSMNEITLAGNWED